MFPQLVVQIWVSMYNALLRSAYIITPLCKNCFGAFCENFYRELCQISTEVSTEVSLEVSEEIFTAGFFGKIQI